MLIFEAGDVFNVVVFAWSTYKLSLIFRLVIMIWVVMMLKVDEGAYTAFSISVT